MIARFMGPKWGPSGAEGTQVGPILAPWTLLYGRLLKFPLKDKKIWPLCRAHFIHDEILWPLRAWPSLCILLHCPDRKVHGANMGLIWGPTGPRWVPCRSHELCYLGSLSGFTWDVFKHSDQNSVNDFWFVLFVVAVVVVHVLSDMISYHLVVVSVCLQLHSCIVDCSWYLWFSRLACVLGVSDNQPSYQGFSTPTWIKFQQDFTTIVSLLNFIVCQSI